MPLDRRQLDRLRDQRLGPLKDLGLGDEIASLAREASRQGKRFGGLGEAWNAMCPPELLASTVLQSLTRGVLTVGVADASARFKVDLWLRSGGETELIKRCPTLLRVRLR
jgi:hypothetical protein